MNNRRKRIRRIPHYESLLNYLERKGYLVKWLEMNDLQRKAIEIEYYENRRKI